MDIRTSGEPSPAIYGAPAPSERGGAGSPSRASRRRWRGYAFAVAAFFVAFAVRWALLLVLPVGAPFIAFLPAIILSAYFFGSGPGIFCAVLAGCAGWLLFMPTMGMVPTNASSLLTLCLYTFVVGMNVFVIELMRTARARGETLLETQRTLLEELERETKLRKANEALAEKTILLDMALQAADAGTWRYCVETGRAQFSARMAQHHGFGDAPIEIDVLADWKPRVHPEDAERTLSDLQAAIATRSRFLTEFRVLLENGGLRWVTGMGHVQVDGTGQVTGVAGLTFDITARKESEQRIAHLANHDPLTGLANRTLLRERLGEEIARVRRRNASFALLCLDLDRFKAVNDTRGHLVGDVLLKAVADRILATVRIEDTVARIGGDEFVVIQTEVPEPDAAGILAGRLIRAVAEPIEIEGEAVSVGLSVGVALVPHCGEDPDEIYRAADRALYRAKSEGRNTFRIAG